MIATSGAAASLDPVPSAGCGSSGLAPGPHEFEVKFGGIDRTYGVHVPASHDNDTPAPVLMNFHSLLLGGPALRKYFSTMSNQTVKSESAGFIVIEADGTAHESSPGSSYVFSWNAGEACCNPAEAQDIDDVGYVVHVLEEMMGALCIDRRRIYASGMSNGGYLSHRLACEIPDSFAAIAPVVGSLSPELTCTVDRGVPVLQISGNLDGLSSRQASVDHWVQHNACGPETTVSVVDDTTCTTHTNCRDGVEVRHCVVDPGKHCFFTNAELPFMTDCPTRPSGPLAHDMIWDFLSAYALATPAPEPTSGQLAGAVILTFGVLARGRSGRSGGMPWIEVSRPDPSEAIAGRPAPS